MEIKYNKLKEKITELRRQKPGNITSPIQEATNSWGENSKKFVLYGLEQIKQETEYDLHDRVIQHVIYEIINVDLNGYLQEITRLGRNGYRRPLVIELLSKKMTKYIIHQSSLFSKSGIAFAEFLDNEAIKKRNKLRKILKEARKEGRHAKFRNNRLIINGRAYTEVQKEETNQKLTQTAYLTKEITGIPKTDDKKQNRNKRSFRNRP